MDQTQTDQATARDIPEKPLPLSAKAGFINADLLTPEQANEIDGLTIWYTGAQKFTEAIVDYDRKYNQGNDRKPYEMRQFGITVRELFFTGDSLTPVVRILVEKSPNRSITAQLNGFEGWASNRRIWLERVDIVPDIFTYDPDNPDMTDTVHIEYIIRENKKDIAQREQ